MNHLEAAGEPSLWHLLVFEKVAELQSVSRAAEAVLLTQPAVTHAIEKVETQIGTRLFDRRNRGSFVTGAGVILSARCRRMFDQIRTALEGFGLSRSKPETIATIMRRTTRQQIVVLTAVSACGSFSGAARSLGMPHATVHRAARDIERNLGKSPFRNCSSGITTTRPGAEFGRLTTLALREIGWAIDEIRAATEPRGGNIKVGAMPRAGSYMTGAVLNELERCFPAAQISALVNSGATLSDALRTGEIDMIVGMHHGSQDTADIVFEPLLVSPFVVVGRKGHPLARCRRLRITDLEGYQWVTPNPGAARMRIFDQLFAAMAKPPCFTIRANAFSTTRMLLAGSDRLTLLSKFEFESESDLGTLEILPFPPIPTEETLGVAQRAGWAPTPLHSKFLELLRVRAEQIALVHIC